MAHTLDELKHMTVAQLREIAESEIDHEAVEGYKTMHKADLFKAVCTALGIDTLEHHEIVGIDKTKLKAQIKAQKAKRDAAIEAKDHTQLKRARHNIRRLKRKIRRYTV